MRGLEAGPPQRVALVNMPFAGANRPSIQCGLLKAGLVREGHEVDVHYLNLELAAEIGEVTYRRLADLRWDHLLGEWLFSAADFGPRDDEEAYPRRTRACRRPSSSSTGTSTSSAGCETSCSLS